MPNLYQLAEQRLKQLFPHSAFVLAISLRPIDGLLARPQCRVRACCYPAFKSGLCRTHLQDRHSEYSMLPSSSPMPVPKHDARFSPSASN